MNSVELRQLITALLSSHLSSASAQVYVPSSVIAQQSLVVVLVVDLFLPGVCFPNRLDGAGHPWVSSAQGVWRVCVCSCVQCRVTLPHVVIRCTPCGICAVVDLHVVCVRCGVCVCARGCHQVRGARDMAWCLICVVCAWCVLWVVRVIRGLHGLRAARALDKTVCMLCGVSFLNFKSPPKKSQFQQTNDTCAWTPNSALQCIKMCIKMYIKMYTKKCITMCT